MTSTNKLDGAMMTDEKLTRLIGNLREYGGRNTIHPHSGAWMTDAADALELLSASKPAAPEGWKLVPIEPTPEMFNAGQACGGYADRVYRSMLAASPAAPAQSAEPRNVDGMTRAEFEAHLRVCFQHDNVRARERGGDAPVSGLTADQEREIAERVELNYPTVAQCSGCTAFDSDAAEVHFVQGCEGCTARMQKIAGFGPLYAATQPAQTAQSEVSPIIAPYPNCSFRICDLPGQCRAEGKCHHPVTQPAQTERALTDDARDAARYRWLRENRPVLLLTGFFGNGCVNRRIEEVDNEIDAALTTAHTAPWPKAPAPSVEQPLSDEQIDAHADWASCANGYGVEDGTEVAHSHWWTFDREGLRKFVRALLQSAHTAGGQS